jgi:hypothetical protein
MDTATPFTLAIPIPAASALAEDPFANLAVIYHVKKVGSGNADFTGILTRDQLVITGSHVSFQTTFFGTYQAVLTASPVTLASEVAALPSTPEFGGGRSFFVGGPLMATFGGQAGLNGQSLRGLHGWVHKRTPGGVGGPAALEADYVSKIK